MHRLLALALTIAIDWFVVTQAKPEGPAPRSTALALGFALIAAALTGAVFVLALMAMHELIGPVLFKAALARTGEIGRMDATPAPSPATP